MTEGILTVLGLGTLSQLSLMAFLTLLVVQTLKQVVPKKFPTQLLTIIVALVIAILLPMVLPGAVITVASVIAGIFNGLIVAFISMNGFDSLKDIWNRIKNGKEDDNDGTLQ